jgi:hypothetical protein
MRGERSAHVGSVDREHHWAAGACECEARVATAGKGGQCSGPANLVDAGRLHGVAERRLADLGGAESAFEWPMLAAAVGVVAQDRDGGRGVTPSVVEKDFADRDAGGPGSQLESERRPRCQQASANGAMI